MNRRFNHKQIRAYAAQFREGDAIWCDDKWHEVIISKSWNRDSRIGVNVIGNTKIINFGREWHKPYKGVEFGFIDLEDDIDGVDTPYRVTTFEHYKLKGGENIVWLGKDDSFRTFGKVYKVDSSGKYRDDEGDSLYTDSHLWGIIPHYEQVKNINKTTIAEKVSRAVSEKLEKLSPYEQVACKHNISKEELLFILDECDNGRTRYIINSLIELRSKWHEKEVNEMNEQNKNKIIELAKQISEILKETADPHTNVIIDINEVKVTQDTWKDNIGGEWN